MEEAIKDDIFNNRKRAQQMIRFDGIIRVDGVRPTNIDGAMGYGRRLFPFFEGKVKGTKLPKGQKRYFEDIIHVLKDGGASAYAIIFEHTIPETEDVFMGEQMVCEYFYSKTLKWRKPKNPITVFQAIELMENFEKIGKKTL